MYKEIDATKLIDNPFELIGNEWMLISAGNAASHNMMTASWGGLGVLWNSNVATVYIRLSRYTLGFVEAESHFALSFFGKNKKIHGICGSKSGRDIDKTKATGLTPIYADNTVYFEEAELVLICRKLYQGKLDNAKFCDPALEGFYKEIPGDYHKVFIGEIIKTLIKPTRA